MLRLMGKKKWPLVSVILPSYNSKGFIEKCLPSLLMTDYPNFEVVMVNDGSTDGSGEWVEKHFRKEKKLRVIKNPRNMKLAVSRNRGIEVARGDYVAFAEVDMEFGKNWLKEGVGCLLSDKALAGVQLRVMDIHLRDRLQFMEIYMWPQTGWMINPGALEKVENLELKSKEVLGGPNSMIYRKEVLLKVGKFDEKLGFNIDDLDLNWRLWLAGYKIKTCPDAVIYHWTVKDWSKKGNMPKWRWEWEYAKLPRVFIKNYSLKYLVRYLPSLGLILVLRATMFLVGRNLSPWRGLIAATWWNLTNLPDTLRQWRWVQGKLRKKRDEEIMRKIAARGRFLGFYAKYTKESRQKTLHYIEEARGS